MQPPRLIWIDIVSCSFVADLTFSGQPSSFPHPPPCCSFMASSDVIYRFFCPYMARHDVFVYRVLLFLKASCHFLLSMSGSRFARSQGIFCPLLWDLPRIGELRLIGAFVITFSLL